MTRLDIQTRLQNHFNNTIYYTVDDLNNSIQDGWDEIAAFTGCVYKSAVLPFTQYTSYYDMLTLLPDYIGVIAMFNLTTKRWLWPTSLRKLAQARIDWDSCFGTPYYFCPVNHRYVAIYKKPGAAAYGNFAVFYAASAAELDDSTVIPLPAEDDSLLESYCKTDLWEQAQEFQKAGFEMKNYVENLDQLVTLMKSKRNRDRLPSLH